MFEKWKEVLDNAGSCGALLIHLSKTFDCTVHNILLEKLSAYGFDCNSLGLINIFISSRKFWTKIGSCLSPLSRFISGCSSKVYCLLRYALRSESDIINYVDDTDSMLVNQIWNFSWVNFKKPPLQFLHDFRTTTRKLIAENHIF